MSAAFAARVHARATESTTVEEIALEEIAKVQDMMHER